MRNGKARLVSAVAMVLVIGTTGFLAQSPEDRTVRARGNMPVGSVIEGGTGGSRAVTVSRPTLIRPLREIRPQRAAWHSEGGAQDAGERAGDTLFQVSRDVYDPVVQRHSPRSQVPGPLLTFEGMNSGGRVYPPDTNGDVGPAHYMQWINGFFAIYDKRTGALIHGPTLQDVLFTGQPNCAGGGFDPIVLYDGFAERWLGAYSTFTNYSCIAISQTSDPTGAWCAYEFLPDPGGIPDYPKFGVWPSQAAYIQVADMLNSGRRMVVGYERDRMLDCETARLTSAEVPGSSVSLPLPADADGDRPPPRGAPAPLLGLEPTIPGPANTLLVWNTRITWGTTPSLSVVRQYIRLATAPYDPSLCRDALSPCIPQPGTTQGLTTLSDVLMHRLQYRNFGDWQTMVVSHSVDTGDDHAGVRWYRIEKIGSASWRVADQGTYAPDAVHRWMPSVAMDRSGNLAIGYAVSDGSTVYPGIRYTGKLATDPPRQMQAENTIAAGSGVQTNLGGRWGDYAAMAVDPVDDCTFYFTSEYVQTTGRTTWQSRVGAFRFPSCGQAPSFPGCRVPRVVGLTLIRAKARIRARRCKVGGVRRVRARRPGRVLRQTPRAGAVRPRGTKVSLVVGRRGR